MLFTLREVAETDWQFTLDVLIRRGSTHEMDLMLKRMSFLFLFLLFRAALCWCKELLKDSGSSPTTNYKRLKKVKIPMAGHGLT